jgi:hypothetical protein
VVIEREIRGQCVSLQHTGEADRVERFSLIGDLSQRAETGIAEPVACGRGLPNPAKVHDRKKFFNLSHPGPDITRQKAPIRKD